MKTPPWPAQEPAPDEDELLRAKEFGESISSLLEGRPPAAGGDAMAASRMIRASVSDQPLGPARRDAILELAIAEGRRRPARAAPGLLRRTAPLLVLAASVLILLSALWTRLPAGRRHADQASPPPARMLSRSSDDLLGRPIEDRAGASRRLDLVFADRLGGYRQVTLLHRGAP